MERGEQGGGCENRSMTGDYLEASAALSVGAHSGNASDASTSETVDGPHHAMHGRQSNMFSAVGGRQPRTTAVGLMVLHSERIGFGVDIEARPRAIQKKRGLADRQQRCLCIGSDVETPADLRGPHRLCWRVNDHTDAERPVAIRTQSNGEPPQSGLAEGLWADNSQEFAFRHGRPFAASQWSRAPPCTSKGPRWRAAGFQAGGMNAFRPLRPAQRRDRCRDRNRPRSHAHTPL
jgi:hypothetical protein